MEIGAATSYLHHAVKGVLLKKKCASDKLSEPLLQAAAEKLTLNSEKSCANQKILTRTFSASLFQLRNNHFRMRLSLDVSRPPSSSRKHAPAARATTAAAPSSLAGGRAPSSNATAREAAVHARRPRLLVAGPQLSRISAQQRAAPRSMRLAQLPTATPEYNAATSSSFRGAIATERGPRRA